MDPYSKFMVFQIMYLAACNSPSLQFRDTVMSILNSLILPVREPFRSRWFYVDWWGPEAYYYFVRAEAAEFIEMDLRRIKWAESLKIISIFKFWPTDPDLKLVKDGKEVSQNRWVYEQVLRVLPRNRVAVAGRKSKLTVITKDFPELPRVYHLLEITKYPPTFRKIKACNYHLYKDDHPDMDVEDEDD